MNLRAIFSHPFTWDGAEVTSPHLTKTSWQEGVESSGVTSLGFLFSKQPQLPLPLPTGHFLTLHQFCSPSLDTLQNLSDLFEASGLKLNTELEVQPQRFLPVLISFLSLCYAYISLAWSQSKENGVLSISHTSLKSMAIASRATELHIKRSPLCVSVFPFFFFF